jgi:hypothetical protein
MSFMIKCMELLLRHNVVYTETNMKHYKKRKIYHKSELSIFLKTLALLRLLPLFIS